MSYTDVREFEDRRWASTDQAKMWRHEAALRLLELAPVIDVGGGDGFFLTLVRQQEAMSGLVTLADISPVGLKKARNKNLEGLQCDITQPLPFRDQAFGTACALDVLEHLYNPLAVLREMSRIAREVVVVTPNFHYWKDRMRMLMGKVPFQLKPKRGHVHWFNYQMVKTMTDNADLVIDKILFGGVRRLGPVGDLGARWRPNLFAHSFAIKLKARNR